MTAQQTFEVIAPEQLRERVREAYDRGNRLVQISATRLPETFELTYSFDQANRLTNLRFEVPVNGARVQSVSGIYGSAFLYENEIHDLFNVEFEGLTVNFKGTLYKTSVKYAFGTIKAPPKSSAKPAATPGAATAASASPPRPGKGATTVS